MKKLLSILLVVLTAISCLVFTGCNAKLDTEKYWKIVAYDTGEGTDAIKQRVCFNLTRNSKKVDEVWIKVVDMESRVESVNITLQRYTTDTTENSTSIEGMGEALNTAITRAQYRTARDKANGWIKVTAEAWGHDSSYVLFICAGNITVDEIVFVDEDGNQLSYDVDYADFVYEDQDGKTSSKVYDSAEMEALKASARYGTPLNVNNNQESFKTKA